MAETKYICHLFMFIFEYKITITLERKICMKISGFQAVPFFYREHLDREELGRNFPGFITNFPQPFARMTKNGERSRLLLSGRMSTKIKLERGRKILELS